MVEPPSAGAEAPAPDPDPTRTVVVTRAPSDVLRLVVAIVLLLAAAVVGRLFGDATVGFAARLLSGFATLPSWLVAGFAGLVQLAAIALAGLGLVSALRSASWRLLVSVAVALALGALVTAGLVHIVDSHDARVTDFTPMLALGWGSAWTAAGLGGLAAGVAAVCPWVSRRWRRAAWATLLGVALSSS